MLKYQFPIIITYKHVLYFVCSFIIVSHKDIQIVTIISIERKPELLWDFLLHNQQRLRGLIRGNHWVLFQLNS